MAGMKHDGVPVACHPGSLEYSVVTHVDVDRAASIRVGWRMLKCGALVCGILVAATCERGVARSEYRSPTNEYSVRLTSGGAGPFWLEQAVWATAARRTSPLGTDLEIHTADFMDSTF